MHDQHESEAYLIEQVVRSNDGYLGTVTLQRVLRQIRPEEQYQDKV